MVAKRKLHWQPLIWCEVHEPSTPPQETCAGPKADKLATTRQGHFILLWLNQKSGNGLAHCNHLVCHRYCGSYPSAIDDISYFAAYQLRLYIPKNDIPTTVSAAHAFTARRLLIACVLYRSWTCRSDDIDRLYGHCLSSQGVGSLHVYREYPVIRTS